MQIQYPDGRAYSYSAIVEPAEEYMIGWLKHDYELKGVWEHDYKYRAYPQRKNKPETVYTARKDQFVAMTPELDALMFANFAYCAFGTFYPNTEQKAVLRTSWEFFLQGNRAWTNGWGLASNQNEDLHSESIYGINAGRTPWRIDGLNSGGNIVRLIGDPVTIRGVLSWPIDSLHPNQSYDIEETNVTTRPDLFPVSTIARWEEVDMQLIDGKKRMTYHVPPFSHKSHPGGHWPFLNISDGPNYIPVSRVRILWPGELIPNPYNPPRLMRWERGG